MKTTTNLWHIEHAPQNLPSLSLGLVGGAFQTQHPHFPAALSFVPGREHESAQAVKFGGRRMENEQGDRLLAESAGNSLGTADSVRREFRRVPLTWVGGDLQPTFRIEVRPAWVKAGGC